MADLTGTMDTTVKMPDTTSTNGEEKGCAAIKTQ